MLSTNEAYQTLRPNKPMVVTFNGEFLSVFDMLVWNWGTFNKNLHFEYGEDTDVKHGCAASFMGEMWYFGGDNWAFNYKRQVCFLPLVLVWIIYLNY